MNRTIEKISRDDFVRVLDEAFKDNLNDWRYNRILEVADAYADYEYEARKSLRRSNGEKIYALHPVRIRTISRRKFSCL